MHLKRRFIPARCLCHMESFKALRAETPGGQLICVLSALYIKQIITINITVILVRSILQFLDLNFLYISKVQSFLDLILSRALI